MSGPYVYTPKSQYKPTPYIENSPLPEKKPSPFIPTKGLYPHSPYSHQSELPADPNTPHHIPQPFPALPDVFEPGQWSVPQRPRKLSWNGVSTAAASPPSFPAMTLYPPQPYPAAPVTFERRKSFSGYNLAPPPLWSSPSTNALGLTTPGWGYVVAPPPPKESAPSQRLIHPLLNGEAPMSSFYFDLATPTFSPIRSANGVTQLLTPEELQQPATHPPITSLKIVCDAIPQWPITFAYNVGAAAQMGLNPNEPTPISVGDILVSIHSQLHRRITHADWAQLSAAEEKAVAKAYTKRYKLSPPESQDAEKQNGVVRVDYLGANTRFVGLIKDRDDWSVAKMIVAPSSN